MRLYSLVLFACIYIPAWAQVDSGDFDVKMGEIVYQSAMNDRESVDDWVMEGPGVLSFEEGWMQMYSPDQEMHHVFWCPVDFPESFVAEWEAQNLDPEAGLVIVFFAATGVDQEDIFDPSLPPRDGTFDQYTQGKIRSYHISYYANALHNLDRGHANLRKNNTFTLLQKGLEGIPTQSMRPHKVRLVKDGARIIMFVDEKKIIDHVDDNTEGPVLRGGKIGFRQMKWTRFQYRNFKVWSLGKISDEESVSSVQ